ncbi:MAG: zf-HC2 domain-containing protein [Actinobacteria bacterium]|nr:zf-HC2 domain-containing protein [Actinomycetota bacterium]
MSVTWHLDDDALDSYVAGSAPPALAASVEAHVLACAGCRERLVPAVALPRLDRIWDDVVERIDAPVPRPVERLLLRLGVRDDTARLLAATPSLRAAWFLSMLAVLGLALLSAHATDRGVVVFLALAPLLPVAGVAMSYSPLTDPVHELATAAPYSSLRLLVVRSAAVLTATVLLAGAAAMLLPGASWLAVAWLLPALALTAGTLALSTWFEPLHSALGLATLWLAVTAPAFAPNSDPLLVVRSGAQLACLAVLVVALGTVAVRRDAFSLSMGRSV